MKTVVISGGANGIGKATVERFSQAGYYSYILDIQKPKQNIFNSQFIACDIANINEIQASIKKIANNCASIDALVCNAGIHYSANIIDTDLESYDKVLDINFRGAFFLTQSVLPIMIQQKKGSIVFMGSDQTLIAKPNSAIYAASKAALGSLAKTTAIDYAHVGIRANLIAAGSIDTPLYQAAIAHYCEKTGIEPHIMHNLEAKEQPIGRIGRPDEVAHLIYFLCSDEAAFITGGIYSIDGGYTAK